jgi:hypothetical protein
VFYNAAFVDVMDERGGGRRCSPSRSSIATLRDHIPFLISLISQVVQNLDRCPADIFKHIDEIGRS